LHWNLAQIAKVGEIGRRALDSYGKISRETCVEMHSRESAEKRVSELLKGRDNFIKVSRGLAKQAQRRESLTFQPKEKLSGTKATLTIVNYLGGNYYFTCDEVSVERDKIYLIEGKHTRQGSLPSLEDIKDGLVKMILLSNLKEVTIGNKQYSPTAMLKLTSDTVFQKNKLREFQLQILRLLKREARQNNFSVLINSRDLENIRI
jgi:hypothetical protein